MNKKLSFDIGIVAPILLGVFSLLGICVVFGAWRYKEQRAPVQAAATGTPFRYIYLGTEPGLSTLTPEPTATPVFTDTPEFTPTPIPSPIITLPTVNNNFPTQTFSPLVVLPTSSKVSPTQTSVKAATPTITPTIQAVLSKVDDTYFEILYIGNWTSQSNVIGAHQNTLHISFTSGNMAQYTFVGQQVIVSFQAGPSLGTININLDGSDFILDQSSSQTQLIDWRSPVLVRGTHTLLIEHLSGGSVNLDSLTIPDLSTATPNP